MMYRKNSLSYICWGLYIAFAILFSALMLPEITLSLGFPGGYGILLGLGLFLMGIVLSVLLRIRYRRCKSVRKESAVEKWIFYGIILLVLAAGILLKVRNLWGIDYAPGVYFDYARIDGSGVPTFVYGADTAYCFLLNKVLYLFGNRQLVAYIFNCLFGIAGSIFCTISVVRLSGRISGLVVAVFLSFSELESRIGLFLGTDAFLFFLFSLGLFLISVFANIEKLNAGKIIGLVFSGLGIGCAIALDWGLVVLVFAVSFFLMSSENTVTVRVRLIKSGILLFCIILGIAAVWFVDGICSGLLFFDIMKIQFGYYFDNGFGFSMDMGFMAQDLSILILSFVMLFGLCGGLLSLQEYGTGYIIMLAAVVMLDYLSIKTYDGSVRIIFLFLFAAITGAALEGFRKPQFYSDKTVAAKTKDPASESEEKEESVMDLPEVTRASEEDDSAVDWLDRDEEEEVLVSAPPKMLENPLPVPKKKPHRTMDYDIEIGPDDDYDI